MSPLDWAEVERSAKQSKKERGGGGGRLYLEDGDSVELRFFAKEGEPYIYKRHYDAKTGKYLVCAEDWVKAGEHEGCVACAIAKTLRGKGARLKSPQRLYAVSVFDPRKYHYVESKADDEKYQDCSDDESCRYCKKNIDRKIRGVRHWSMAENVALQLRTFERDQLSKKCRRCQGGKIKVRGYQCPVCESDMEVDSPGEEQRCIPCEKEMGKRPVLRVAKEVIACTNCGPKGRRMTLANAWIIVSKSGKRQSTTWNFGLGDVEPFDPEPFLKEFKDDLKKIEPINFAEHGDFQPLSAAEMALLLDVDNPFSKGSKKRALSDDDDDEDEDDEDVSFKGKKKTKPVDDDDDDDDDPPRKKKKRPTDDDEDEDEDIFD